MKKITYSIAATLVFSVILALIFPAWFLKKDARWTYLSDTARIEVYASGDVGKGRMKVEGANMRITQPKWLSRNNFQGAMVEFPVSYRKNTIQIKLTSQAEATSRNAILVIKFWGNNHQYKGGKMSVRVTFRNLTLDGKLIAAEKRVWRGQSFRLQCPLHPSRSIALAFDVYKPFSASDFSYINFLAAFLMLCIFFTFFSQLRTAASRIIDFVCHGDIVQVLSDSYRHIDLVYRRSFWIILGVLCFAFGFHTICFMWGNHDWYLLNSNQHWSSLAWCGRYMINAVKIPLSNGIYLPLIYDFITFVTLAVNAVLLCRYWHLQKRVTYYVLCGLVLTVQPFTLCMLYYIHMLPEVFIGETFLLVALLVSEKSLQGGGIPRRCICSLLPIILVNFAMAMYPVLLNTIAVVFVGRMLVQSFDWDGSWRNLKSCLVTFAISSFNVVLGVTSYMLVISCVFPVRSSYNTDTLPLEHIPERLGVLFRQCFHQLYEYDMPFISQWVMWIFLGFSILLTLYICITGNFRQKIVRLSLLFGALLTTQSVMIIAKTHLIDGRVDLFGLVFFEVLVMVLTITRVRQMRNLSMLAGTCVIFASIINDLDCLRVWKLGFDAEKMLWNRILTRLESQPMFDIHRKYRVVQIGAPISMRRRYYTGHIKIFRGADLLWYSYDPNWSLMSAPEFFYPSRYRNTQYYLGRRKLDYFLQLKRLAKAGVLQKAEEWPRPNGLIVWKDVILFVTDGRELENYKKKYERELRKK